MYAATTVLQKCLSSAFSTMHAVRAKALLGAVSALIVSRRLVLMELARSWPGAERVRAPLKKLDRLLSNEHLQEERLGLYGAMARCLLRGIVHPLIVIDWSDLQAHGRGYLLRAAVPVKGRTVTLLEWVYPPSQKQKPRAERAFLKRLKEIVPDGSIPIIVTDAGYKRPWFKAVRRLGWHYVGRIRGQAIIQFERRGKWRKLQEFYRKASSQPQRFTTVRWGRWRQEELICDLVLWRKASKGRTRLTHTGKRSQSIRSKRAEKREGEPWLLVTSLLGENFSAWDIVKIYAKRMQIEESFRDLKCVRLGCAFDLSLTRSCARLAILLLIHALASFLAWLTALSINDRKAVAAYGGVTTQRRRRHYSLLRLGWLALRHDDPLAQPRWILAALRCLKSNQTILGEIR